MWLVWSIYSIMIYFMNNQTNVPNLRYESLKFKVNSCVLLRICHGGEKQQRKKVKIMVKNNMPGPLEKQGKFQIFKI